MVQILQETSGNLIATRTDGKLTTEDYRVLVPMVEDKIKKHGKIRWYFEMENFHGWQPGAFWEDVKMDVKHFNDFEKVAMVGDADWEKWMTVLMKPFTTASIKYFDISNKEAAKQWIKE